MTWSAGITVAAVFIWLGMVLAISFLEAPLKFRAPGVSLPIGLGIGRLVFRALNAVEIGLAAVIALAMAVHLPPRPALVAVIVAVAALVGQLLAVRPALTPGPTRCWRPDPTPRRCRVPAPTSVTSHWNWSRWRR